jgi:hypothetical protein
MNKKNYILILNTILLAVLFSCEGPEGKIGPQGTKGDVGPAGPAGKDAATARYYDYKLTWTGSLVTPTKEFEIPNFKSTSEYAITYIIGSLIEPLPLKNAAAFEADGKTINIVDMSITYGSSGLTFTREWRYKENGFSEYNFRTVVVPMVKGGRLNSNMPYETLKKLYKLPD